MAGLRSSTCPACDAISERASIRWIDDRHIHCCPSCRLLFVQPLPTSEQLEAFYQGFLYRRPPREKLAKLIDERERELVQLFSLEALPAHNEGRSFLDHGGGTGLAFAAARRLGLDGWFAEMDREAVAHVEQQFGLDSSHLIDSLSDHAGRFDYILSDNVVEHVPDPVGLIRDLACCLKPGGVLVVKTPHAAATDMYFYPRVWSQYLKKVARANGWSRGLQMLLFDPVWCCDPPRHLYSFSRDSLAKMAERAGVQSNRFAIETYETPLLKNSFTERVLKRRRGVRGQVRRAMLVPVLPAEWASKLVQRWSRRAGWLSPGGLILRVRRPRESNGVEAL